VCMCVCLYAYVNRVFFFVVCVLVLSKLSSWMSVFCLFVYVCVCLRMFISSYICAYIICVRVCACVCRIFINGLVSFICMYVYACMYVCMHLYMYAYMCTICHEWLVLLNMYVSVHVFYVRLSQAVHISTHGRQTRHIPHRIWQQLHATSNTNLLSSTTQRNEALLLQRCDEACSLVMSLFKHVA
jgi:hypothetical protein